MGTTVRHLGAAVGGWYLQRSLPVQSLARTAALARRLRLAAERLGPTYIKLGQIVSSVQGIFPAELVEEFKRCRDRVEPERWPVIKRVIEQELRNRSTMSSPPFDPEPLAAASIAQVHAATLHGGVRRRDQGATALGGATGSAGTSPSCRGWPRSWSAGSRSPHWPTRPALVELFAQTIVEELDFRLEAENMLDVAASFAELGQRGYVIPRPHPDAGDPPGAGDGTDGRLPLLRCRGNARRGHRHRGCGADRHDRLSRRLHDARDLPRRHARRQPLRPAVGEGRAARLRHHRPAHRGQTTGAALADRRSSPTGTSRPR